MGQSGGRRLWKNEPIPGLKKAERFSPHGLHKYARLVRSRLTPIMSQAPPPCHCALCGINLQNGLKRRLYNAAQGRRFVLNCCKDTPFLYQVLANPASRLGAPCKQYLCIPCVNWKRRAEYGRLKRTRQPMLQLDQMILFLMQPGRFQEPDHRCMDRLVVSIRQPDNVYRCIFPAPAQHIIRLISGNTYQHCVAAWWVYNGRTEFFSSSQEAKRVRSAVKAGLVQDTAESLESERREGE